MAKRTRKIRHDDETRAKIQASQLINRLTSHALGEIDMTNSQVNAAAILLKKAIPDLQAVTMSGDEDNPLEIHNRVEFVIVDPKA